MTISGPSSFAAFARAIAALLRVRTSFNTWPCPPSSFIHIIFISSLPSYFPHESIGLQQLQQQRHIVFTMTASNSTTHHAAAEPASSLSSHLPPIKPLSTSSPHGLPSLMKLSSIRSYKMPSNMSLPYDTSNNDMKYPLSEASLASLLASRRSHMHRMKQRLASEMPFALSRQVSFGSSTTNDSDNTSMDTSNSSTESMEAAPLPQPHHHEPPACTEEPAPKRRRFQRRNSKTPAMLMSSLQRASDVVVAGDDDGDKPATTTTSSLDGGLEIAQELVRQLQLRRQRSQQQSAQVDTSNDKS